jgi:hypothetical protein
MVLGGRPPGRVGRCRIFSRRSPVRFDDQHRGVGRGFGRCSGADIDSGSMIISDVPRLALAWSECPKMTIHDHVDRKDRGQGIVRDPRGVGHRRRAGPRGRDPHPARETIPRRVEVHPVEGQGRSEPVMGRRSTRLPIRHRRRDGRVLAGIARKVLPSEHDRTAVKGAAMRDGDPGNSERKRRSVVQRFEHGERAVSVIRRTSRRRLVPTSRSLRSGSMRAPSGPVPRMLSTEEGRQQSERIHGGRRSRWIRPSSK